MLLNYHIGRLVLSSLCVGDLVRLALGASACKTSTTQNQPHKISNTQRTENKMTDVVIQQHSRKLLMMDILISETCWAHKKWNKIASDIKLVFHSSTAQTKLFLYNTHRFCRNRQMKSQIYSEMHRMEAATGTIIRVSCNKHVMYCTDRVTDGKRSEVKWSEMEWSEVLPNNKSVTVSDENLRVSIALTRVQS